MLFRRKMFGGVSYLAESKAYFAAAGITSTKEKLAVDTFIRGLQAASFYTRFDRLWLFSPTSSTASLVDFITLTSMTAVGSPGWSTTGYVTNGTSSYLNTGYAMSGSSRVTANSQSQAVYIRTAVSGSNKYMMGCNQSLSGSPLRFYCAGSPATINYYNGNLIKSASGSATAFNGFLMGTTTAIDDLRILKNGSQIATDATSVDGSLSTTNIFIGAKNNNGVANNFCNMEVCFAMVASGFTNAEGLTLYNLVQTYQNTVI